MGVFVLRRQKWRRGASRRRQRTELWIYDKTVHGGIWTCCILCIFFSSFLFIIVMYLFIVFILSYFILFLFYFIKKIYIDIS